MTSIPQRIAIAVFGVSVLFLFLSLVAFLRSSIAIVDYIVIPSFALAFAFSVVELFVGRLRQFLPIFAFHTAVTVLIVVNAASLTPLVNIMLILPLLLTASIRLPARFSVPVGIAVVGVNAIAGGINELADWDRVALIVIELVLTGFCALVALYRDRLVSASQNLKKTETVVNNLSSANEAFVEVLPEMKRESADQERLRVTRELHDTLGYAMTNIVMIMNASQYLIGSDPEQVRRYCRKAKELASETMEDTRRTLYALRAIEDKSPDNPSIFFHKLCADFQEATGIQTECHPGNLSAPLSGPVFHTLLRTAQVGFINALRHGRASKIRVFLWHDDAEHKMTIWNSTDTADLDSRGSNEGIGLRGVRERMDMLGGRVETRQTVDGFTLTIIIPDTANRGTQLASIDR